MCADSIKGVRIQFNLLQNLLLLFRTLLLFFKEEKNEHKHYSLMSGPSTNHSRLYENLAR